MASKNEQPILIKTSITKEIYHGNSLKSRFELNQCKIIPRRPEICGSLSKGKKTSNDNLKKQPKKIIFKSKVKEQNIVLLGKLVYPYIHLPSEESLPIGKVQEELYARILNQNSPIATVIHSLEDLKVKLPPKKMLTCLMGPTGVGKSYLINILREQISSQFIRIFHSSELPHLIAKENYAESYLSTKLYSDFLIIVVDDLKPGDLNRLKRLIEITFSIKDKNILVLAVFNVETEDCLENISDFNNPNFIKEKLGPLSEHFHSTHFKFLNESIVRQWLEKALMEQNISFELHDEIIDTLLKGHNIKCHGLKGLQSKLLLELSEYDKTD